MIRSIGLARTRDFEHVDCLTYGLDDARVAAGLKSAGLAASLYGGRSTGRIQDLTRQLARMRTDAFLFWVCPEVVSAARQLALGLKQLLPTVWVLWWGPSATDSFTGQIADGVADILRATLAEEVIPRLIEAELIAGNPLVQLPSPYMSGLLAAEEVRRLGVTAHQQPSAVVEELNWLKKQGAINGATVPLDGTQLTPRGLEDLCEALASCTDMPKLELHVSVQARPSAVANLLSKSGITKLVLYGREADEEHAAFTPIGIEIGTATIPDHDAAKNIVRGRNGFIALQTGIYPDLNKRSAGIYHLELPLTMERDRRSETYRWAARNLDLSSAAVLTGPLPLPVEELNRFKLPIAQETNGWPKHTYVVTTSEHGRLVVDGCPDTSVAVRFLSYSQLAAAPPQGAVLTVLTIRTNADIAALEERLAGFHATGSLEVFHPDHPTVFENSCRWSRYGGCSVLMLPRLSVEKGGRVIACRDAGGIGNVGDDYDQMLERLRQDRQLCDVRRGCCTCPVRDECSHCIHLPDQWGGRYCEIRKANPQTALFFEVNMFPFLVQRVLPCGKGVLQASVSNIGLPVQHYNGPIGERRKGIRPVIISLSDQHFAWWRGTFRITRLSGPLALVLEGWWLGATESDLQQALCARFKVELSVAESGLREGLLKLQRGGLLNA